MTGTHFSTARCMRRGAAAAAALLLAAAVLVSATTAARGEVTDREVEQCIAKAVVQLKEGQKTDGHWQVFNNRYGGMTALATLALLQAGEPLDDKVVAAGLRALEQTPDTDTYVVALRLMVFAKVEQIAGDQRYRAKIEAAVRWLQDTQSKLGTWGYDAKWLDAVETKQEVIDATDNSNTQMALLGLYEASRAGYKVDDEVWKRSESYFVRTQNSDGSWRYRHGGPAADLTVPKSGSMTAAGLASLLIAGSRLQQASDCGCGETESRRYRNNEAIAQAVSWLDKNFSVERNPGPDRNTWHHYYLYAVERVGIISGLRYIGGHDWFREGADYLVTHQLEDGRFRRSEDVGGVALEYDTAFAILFLAKGHVPVLMHKLRWSDRGEQWNYNMYDLENLTRWLGTRLCGEAVGWQAVDMSDPVEEWLRAPLLYIAGRKPPKFGEAERQKLRRYVELGGTILADACCDSKEFTESMRQLAGQLFGEGSLQVLPEDHPVYSSFERLPPKWPLEGVMFGCRTSFILSTKDLSCTWELATKPTSLMGLRMGLNLAAYATARQPLPRRLARVEQRGDVPEVEMDRMALCVGKVRHNGRDWNSRPLAMDRLLEHLRIEAGIKVASRAVPVRLTDEQLSRFPILYMVGHYDPSLSAEEKQRLKDYLQRGGFLMAEACCGMPEFDKAFRSLMAELFPETPLESIPADSPLLNGQAGYRIERVTYTPLVLKEQPGLDRPKLEGLMLGGRYAVVYSPLALGPGLDRVATFHSRGYAPEDALRIATNILLYALKF